MTRKETANVLSVIKVAYPAFYAKITNADAHLTIDVWQGMFEQEDAAEVMLAVKSYIATDTRGYPPTVGQIKGLLRHGKNRDLSAYEAWALVSKAAENGYYNSREEFSKLPEKVRKVLGRHNILRDYSLMDVKSLESVVRSNFIRDYNALIDSTLIDETYLGLTPPDEIKRIEAKFKEAYDE